MTKGYAESQVRPWILFRYLPPGYVDFYLRDVSGTSRSVRSTQTLNDDRWHHVVGVYDADAGALRLYIDGALDGTATGVPAAPYGTNAGRLTIGNHLDRSIDLAVDEVGVYRGVLSEDRIAAHFAAVAVASEPVDESDGRHFVLSLDGASHAELPYDPAHDPASITVELLARVTGGQETWRAAVSVSGGDASQRLGWFLGVDNEDRWCAQIPDGSGGVRLLVGPRVHLGEWTSIAFTHGGGVFELFVAGHSAARAEGSLERSGAQTPVIIGALIADGLTLNRFRGQLTELRIWNGVLTVEQLAVRLAERAAGDAEGLVALLPLNERDGREARNLVAGGPAATLTGGAWEDAALLEDLTPEVEPPPEETPPEETPPEETVSEGPTEPYIVVSIEPAAAGDARVEIFSGDDYSGISRTLDVGLHRDMFLPRSARIPKGWILKCYGSDEFSHPYHQSSYGKLWSTDIQDTPQYIYISRRDLSTFSIYGQGAHVVLREGIWPVSALGFPMSKVRGVVPRRGCRVVLCSEADGAGEIIALEDWSPLIQREFPTAGPAYNAQSIRIERPYLAIPDAEQHYTLHLTCQGGGNVLGVDHTQAQRALMQNPDKALFANRWRFVPAEEPGWYLLIEPQIGFALTWPDSGEILLYARPRVGGARQHFRLEQSALGLVLRCREGNTPIIQTLSEFGPSMIPLREEKSGLCFFFELQAIEAPAVDTTVLIDAPLPPEQTLPDALDEVVVHQGVDHHGRFTGLPLGGTADLTGLPFEVHSVTVSMGLQVLLYSEVDFGGTETRIATSTADLSAAAGARSARVELLNGVLIYEEEGFRGKARRLGEGVTTGLSGCASVRVCPGWKVSFNDGLLELDADGDMLGADGLAVTTARVERVHSDITPAIGELHQITLSASGRVLSAARLGETWYPVFVRPEDALPAWSVWTFEPGLEGDFRIAHPATNRVLHVVEDSLQSGARLGLGPRSAAGAQRWMLRSSGDGLRIQSRHSGLLLSLPLDGATGVVQELPGAHEQHLLCATNGAVLSALGDLPADWTPALLFDGDVSFVLPELIERLQNTSFTIEVWIRPDNEASQSWLVSGDLQFHTSRAGTWFRLSGTGDIASSGQGTVPSGRWSHVVWRYDLARREMMVLGEVRDARDGEDLLVHGTPLRLGGQAVRSFVQGAIAELRVWSVARSIRDLRLHALRRLGGDEDGLVACYPFLEGSGTTTRELVDGSSLDISGAWWSYGAGLRFSSDAAAEITRLNYRQEVLVDSPIGYWRLNDGEGADKSGRGRTLRFNNLAAGNLAQAGPTPNSFSLRIDPHQPRLTAQVADTSAFAFAAGQSFSVELWMKGRPGNTANYAGLITKGYDAVQVRPWYLLRYHRDGLLTWYVRNEAGATSTVQYRLTPDEAWHHVVCVHDGPNRLLRLYVDGVLRSTASNVPDAAFGTNDRLFTLGDHLSRPQDVLLAEVAVYDKALSEDRTAAQDVEEAVPVAAGFPDPGPVEPVSPGADETVVVEVDAGRTVLLPLATMGSDEVTLELWFRADEVGEGEHQVFSTNEFDPSQRVRVCLVDGQVVMWHPGKVTARSLSRIGPGEWIHIAWINNRIPGFCRLVINGRAEAQTHEPYYGELHLILGSDDPARPFIGAFAEVRLRKRSLTPLELREDMLRRLRGDESDLGLYVPLSDGSGERPVSHVGADAVLRGATWAVDAGFRLAPADRDLRDPRANGRRYTVRVGDGDEVELATDSMSPEQGHCYTISVSHLGDEPDGSGSPERSQLRLFEDGRELGPPHTSHDTIRTDGGGAFSNWNHTLYFSAGVGLPPQVNVPPAAQAEIALAGTDRVLTVESGIVPLALKERDEVPDEARAWRFPPQPDGDVLIQHVLSGQVIGPKYLREYSLRVGQPDGSPAERWALLRHPEGGVRFINALGRSMGFSTDYDLYLGRGEDRWVLTELAEPVEPFVPEPGSRWVLRHASLDGVFTHDNPQASGPPLVLPRGLDAHPAQRWALVHVSDGFVGLVNAYSVMYLGQGGDRYAGGFYKTVMYRAGTSVPLSQQWKLLVVEGGYLLLNRMTLLVLTLDTQGRLGTRSRDDSPEQVFVLERFELVGWTREAATAHGLTPEQVEIMAQAAATMVQATGAVDETDDADRTSASDLVPAELGGTLVSRRPVALNLPKPLPDQLAAINPLTLPIFFVDFPLPIQFIGEISVSPLGIINLSEGVTVSYSGKGLLTASFSMVVDPLIIEIGIAPAEAGEEEAAEETTGPRTDITWTLRFGMPSNRTIAQVVENHVIDRMPPGVDAIARALVLPFLHAYDDALIIVSNADGEDEAANLEWQAGINVIRETRLSRLVPFSLLYELLRDTSAAIPFDPMIQLATGTSIGGDPQTFYISATALLELELGTPMLELKSVSIDLSQSVSATETETEIAASVDLNVQLGGELLTLTGGIGASISPTGEKNVAIDLAMKVGDGVWERPFGLPVDITGFGMTVSVGPTPPWIGVGVRGGLRLGEEGLPTAEFAVLVDTANPQNCVLSIEYTDIDFRDMAQAFFGKDPGDIFDLRFPRLYLYLSPQGGEIAGEKYDAGFRFAGEFELWGYKGSATGSFSSDDGGEIHGALDPLTWKIGDFTVLEIGRSDARRDSTAAATGSREAPPPRFPSVNHCMRGGKLVSIDELPCPHYVSNFDALSDEDQTALNEVFPLLRSRLPSSPRLDPNNVKGYAKVHLSWPDTIGGARTHGLSAVVDEFQQLYGEPWAAVRSAVPSTAASTPSGAADRPALQSSSTRDTLRIRQAQGPSIDLTIRPPSTSHPNGLMQGKIDGRISLLNGLISAEVDATLDNTGVDAHLRSEAFGLYQDARVRITSSGGKTLEYSTGFGAYITLLGLRVGLSVDAEVGASVTGTDFSCTVGFSFSAMGLGFDLGPFTLDMPFSSFADLRDFFLEECEKLIVDALAGAIAAAVVAAVKWVKEAALATAYAIAGAAEEVGTAVAEAAQAFAKDAEQVARLTGAVVCDARREAEKLGIAVVGTTAEVAKAIVSEVGVAAEVAVGAVTDTAEEAVKVLKDTFDYTAEQAGAAVVAIYGYTEQAAADVLKGVGYAAEEVSDFFTEVVADALNPSKW